MTAIRLALSALVAAGVLLAAAPGIAQNPKQAGNDSKAIQSCVKNVKGSVARNGERCIGIVADPCLKRPGALSNADMAACAGREASVWDDILNETFRRLNDKLDAEQKGKLRDMQRAWIEFARPHLRLLLRLPPGLDRGANGRALRQSRNRTSRAVPARFPQ